MPQAATAGVASSCFLVVLDKKTWLAPRTTSEFSGTFRIRISVKNLQLANANFYLVIQTFKAVFKTQLN
jgi:hypothetical protein